MDDIGNPWRLFNAYIGNLQETYVGYPHIFHGEYAGKHGDSIGEYRTSSFFIIPQQAPLPGGAPGW